MRPPLRILHLIDTVRRLQIGIIPSLVTQGLEKIVDRAVRRRHPPLVQVAEHRPFTRLENDAALVGMEEKPTKVVSAATCFHSNDTSWRLAGKLNGRLPPHRSTDDHCTVVVNTDNAAAILAYVDTQN